MAEIPRVPFVVPPDRPRVTHEPDRSAKKWTPLFPDVNWIGFHDMAPAHVPPDFGWSSSPKQHQEEYGTSVGPLPKRPASAG
jgi:hypothetical protein